MIVIDDVGGGPSLSPGAARTLDSHLDALHAQAAAAGPSVPSLPASRTVTRPPPIQTISVTMNDEVVMVGGELDLFGGRVLAAAVLAVLAARPCALLLDLCDLDYIDAAGLGALVHISNEARGRHSSLQLRAGARIRRIFDMTGLSQMLEPT